MPHQMCERLDCGRGVRTGELASIGIASRSTARVARGSLLPRPQIFVVALQSKVLNEVKLCAAGSELAPFLQGPNAQPRLTACSVSHHHAQNCSNFLFPEGSL